MNTKCMKCNSSKFDIKSLSCNNCITESKKEVIKLSKILIDDFGIEKKNIQIYFSGNEGFHVYVYNSKFQELGSRERSELVDYIMFKGIIPETLGMKKINPTRSLFADFDDKGWRGRFSKEIFVSKTKRSKIISELISNGYSTFQKNLEILSSKIGVQIDPSVTMDIHRIFRLPGSLNSKSGLTKIFCKDIEKFDAYSESCFLDDDTIEISVNCPVEFKLKNKKFGPYENEKVTVPTYAASYMICKNFATIS